MLARQPSAPETALVLRLAADQIRDRGWGRPLADDDEIALAIYADGERMRPTIAGAIMGATGIPVESWASLADPRIHDLWDALVLALAETLGLWSQPRHGLEQIGGLLTWERSPVSCVEDVLAVLERAATLAESAVRMVPCPGPHEDAWTVPECGLCHGAGVLALHPDRWTRTALRVVR